MPDDLSANLASLRIDRSAPKKRNLSWLWTSALLLALGGGALAAWPELEARLFKTSVSITTVTSVSPAQATIELTAAGYVQANKNSRVAPKVPGRVLKVYIEQGQKVQAGDPLFELDPADDKANINAALSRVSAAAAQAKSARARVSAAEAELFEAQQKATRERKLAAQGASSTGAAEDLEARAAAIAEQVQSAKAAATAADAEVSALSSQVQVLKTGLTNLTLLAPISGTIVSKPPQIGEFVGPQPAGVSVDMGGVRVADFSTLLVETDIPEGRLSLVKLGAPAEITLDAYPGQRYRGVVKEITPQVDRAKATVLVKVAFVDETEGVLPDMSARVSFLAKELDKAELQIPPKTIIPSSAIVERGGGKVTFVVEDNQVRMVPLELGPAFGSGFEILRGPSPGAQVVSNPPPTLADGQKVKSEDIE